MFDRTAEIRCCRSIIDDHRDARRISNRSNRVEVGDIAAGVCDGFAEHSAGVVVNRRLHRIQIVEINELGRPAEPFDRLAELRDRAAI